MHRYGSGKTGVGRTLKASPALSHDSHLKELHKLLTQQLSRQDAPCHSSGFILFSLF